MGILFEVSNRETGMKTIHRVSARVAYQSVCICIIILLSATMPPLALADEELHPQSGPATIQLGDKATLKLPANFAFINAEEAKSVLKKGGSDVDSVLGIVLPATAQGDSNPSFIICSFDDSGYVKDDDAEKLNPVELLKAYKEGTAEQNEVRKDNGIPPIFVGNWAELPHYNKARHHVVWGLEVKDQDDANAKISGINYNTRILGRKGVLSMNLVSSQEKMPASLKDVASILGATSFVKGQSYEDYKPGQDKEAGYSIGGLILGGGAMAAAAKFGVFGALWKWILAAILICKKFLIVIVVAIGGLFSKLFGKKKES